MQKFGVFFSLLLVFGHPQGTFAQNQPAVTEKEELSELKLDRQIQELTAQLVTTYSHRGDAWFFRGSFPQAVADYEQMVELNPDLSVSHWRLGIAWFYAGEYKKAATQFENYHTFDNVDRENGIWRYFSQYKAYGKEKAREGLLKYEKDDRQPFPLVYQLFAGKITPEEILKQIEAAELSEDARSQQEFYARLYIGLNEALEGRPDSARVHLKVAAESTWGRDAGYGPNYMWQVGRLHLKLLEEAAKPEE